MGVVLTSMSGNDTEEILNPAFLKAQRPREQRPSSLTMVTSPMRVEFQRIENPMEMQLGVTSKSPDEMPRIVLPGLRSQEGL